MWGGNVLTRDGRIAGFVDPAITNSGFIDLCREPGELQLHLSVEVRSAHGSKVVLLTDY